MTLVLHREGPMALFRLFALWGLGLAGIVASLDPPEAAVNTVHTSGGVRP